MELEFFCIINDKSGFSIIETMTRSTLLCVATVDIGPGPELFNGDAVAPNFATEH